MNLFIAFVLAFVVMLLSMLFAYGLGLQRGVIRGRREATRYVINVASMCLADSIRWGGGLTPSQLKAHLTDTFRGFLNGT